ncbi:hypothetical protein FJT64_006964 [Amphibalanus amphitrite]|uniref:Uncharacterized protein n=1 Tax=Amphibalanus amphitrite TaxID=1232801 RepID=A0A6A4VPG0_AMPAM|nr:hypothetical protein FJT64_006964 [Amphibalanus amphitrite]
MCVFLCWKSRVAFGWRLDCALGEWITMGGNRKDATSRKTNLQCTRDSREKLFARARTGDPSPSPTVSRSDAHRIQTEESEALDEPVSCRAEDAASEDRQFRLVNLAALTPSSWPTGECLHSSSLAPPLRVRVQTAVGPRASLAASVVAVLRGGMHPGAAG